MAKHLLTDRAIRIAKPRATPYRLADGGNLYLLVAPTGAHAWQLRYRLNGKPQTATLGKLAAMSLADARKAAGRARPLADAGEHLTAVKHASRLKRSRDAKTTFASVAADWQKSEARRAQWSADYRAEVEASIRNHLADLDGLPIADITAPIAAPVLRAVEIRAPLMWEKIRSRLRAILDYAVERGDIVGNPLPAMRRGKKRERKHYPAVTDLKGVGAILRAARATDPCKGIARAHLLLVFTALRVSEVVGAQWSEFDLKAGEWHVPRARMKRKDASRGAHVVPLPAALLAALRQWRDADGTDAIYVCPAPRDPSRHVTAEGCEKFYRDALHLQGKHSPHSWRSAFSTICREHGKDADVVEAQLDHQIGTKTASAYDRARRVALRADLLQWYERQLVAARDGANVVALRKRR